MQSDCFQNKNFWRNWGRHNLHHGVPFDSGKWERNYKPEEYPDITKFLTIMIYFYRQIKWEEDDPFTINNKKCCACRNLCWPSKIKFDDSQQSQNWKMSSGKKKSAIKQNDNKKGVGFRFGTNHVTKNELPTHKGIHLWQSAPLFVPLEGIDCLLLMQDGWLYLHINLVLPLWLRATITRTLGVLAQILSWITKLGKLTMFLNTIRWSNWPEFE